MLSEANAGGGDALIMKAALGMAFENSCRIRRAGRRLLSQFRTTPGCFLPLFSWAGEESSVLFAALGTCARRPGTLNAVITRQSSTHSRIQRRKEGFPDDATTVVFMIDPDCCEMKNGLTVAP
jgi:hypothetical protein